MMLNAGYLMICFLSISGLSSCLPIEQGREDRSQFEISDMFNNMDSGDNTVSRSQDFYFLEHLLFKWLCSNHYRVSDTPYCNSNPTLSALRANRIASDEDRADRRGWRENMLHKLMN